MRDGPRPTRGVGWVFLFAMRRESKPFTRHLRFVEKLAGAPCSARLYQSKSGPAVVLETGIGADRAAVTIAQCTISTINGDDRTS